MNAIRFLLTSQGGAFVLNTVVAATLILGVTSLLALITRRRATIVYAICLSGLVATLLVPLAVALLDGLSVRITLLSFDSLGGQAIADPESGRLARNSPADQSQSIEERKESQRSNRTTGAGLDSVSELPELESAVGRRNTDAVADGSNQVDFYRTLATWAAVIWLTGVLFKLAKAAHGVHVIRQAVRQGRPLLLDGCPGLVQQVQLAIKSPRLPCVLECRSIRVPMAVGILRPAVLVPEGLARQLGLPELRDVLVHECGHLLRKDNLIAWLQLVAEAVLWFHPLVYFVNQRLARACEELCDNLVIRDGSRTRFAQLLLNFAKRGCHPTATAFSIVDQRWRLEHRISALLDPGRSTATHVGWARGQPC